MSETRLRDNLFLANHAVVLSWKETTRDPVVQRSRWGLQCYPEYVQEDRRGDGDL